MGGNRNRSAGHNTIKVYTLSCPTTGRVRYVGITSQSLAQRKSQHKTDPALNHRTNWINSLLRQGEEPLMEVIDTCKKEDVNLIESYWISQFKTWGFSLLNATEGGYGVPERYKNDPAALKKLKEKMRSSHPSKRIYQYTLIGGCVATYSSPREAAEVTGLIYRNILQCANLEKKSHGGYIWSFLPPSKFKLTNYRHKQRSGNKTSNNSFVKKATPVMITYPTGETQLAFSIREASLLTEKSSAGICEECKGKRKTRGNFKFSYYEQA